MKEKVLSLLMWFTNMATQTVEYKDYWSPEFSKKELCDYKNMLDEEMKKFIDWDNLTQKDCDDLGFGRYSKESDLRLIPLYLLSVVPVGLEVTSILGKKVINDGKNLDNDHRCGYTAYGIIPKK